MAENGVRMSQYYTSPMFAPARAMLLTVGKHQSASGYRRYVYENTIGMKAMTKSTDRVTTSWLNALKMLVATLRRWRVQWHLGLRRSTPKDRGFRHSFALMGEYSHFDDAVPLGTVEIFPHTYYTATISAFHCSSFTPAKPMPARLIAGSARRHGNNLSSRGWPLLRHMILPGIPRMNAD